jgi:hypothetical protein
MVASLSVLSLILFVAETYFPNQSSNLFPRQSDRISRWLIKPSYWQNSQKAETDKTGQQKELFLQLDQKQSTGKTELIYRGLAGRSQFRIDVIILELDPYVSYSYRFKISEAKKSFRLANRNYQLIAAKKGALHLRLINPQ